MNHVADKAARQLMRDHVKWVNEDPVLRTALIARPIETMARAAVAEIDRLLMGQLPRVNRDKLEQTRSRLVAVIELAG